MKSTAVESWEQAVPLDAATQWPELKKKKSEPVTLQAVGLKELMELDLPERRRLLPWLPEGGLAMVFGPRGVGKTYFTIGLAVALARGDTFLRWPVAHAAGVLLVDGEMALSELRERVCNLLPGPTPEPLEVASHELIFARSERDLNLGLAEWQDAFMDYLDERPEIRVVILDNLACLLPGVAEDKRDDWATKVSPFLIALRRRGVACVMVHHAGKGGDQRGTSAREDSLDTVIRLERPSDHDATAGARFTVRFTKSRGAHGDDVAAFDVALETAQDGAPMWTWKPLEESNAERLLALVRDGISSVTDAAEELGLTKGAVSKLKKRLVGQGMLTPGRELLLAPDE